MSSRSVSYHRNVCRLPLLLHHLVLFHFPHLQHSAHHDYSANSFSDFPKYFTVNTTFALYFFYNLPTLCCRLSFISKSIYSLISCFLSTSNSLSSAVVVILMCFFILFLILERFSANFPFLYSFSFLFVPICDFDYCYSILYSGHINLFNEFTYSFITHFSLICFIFLLSHIQSWLALDSQYQKLFSDQQIGSQPNFRLSIITFIISVI